MRHSGEGMNSLNGSLMFTLRRLESPEPSRVINSTAQKQVGYSVIDISATVLLGQEVVIGSSI